MSPAPAVWRTGVQTAVAHYQRMDKITGVLGGDHSAAIGSALAALQRHPAMSVLYIDAHADLRDDYQGARWGHASAARRIAEHCPLTLAGVRTLAAEERDYITAAAVPVTYWPPDRADYIDRIIATLADPVYISLDLDALDPVRNGRRRHPGTGRNALARTPRPPPRRRPPPPHRRL